MKPAIAGRRIQISGVPPGCLAPAQMRSRHSSRQPKGETPVSVHFWSVHSDAGAQPNRAQRSNLESAGMLAMDGMLSSGLPRSEMPSKPSARAGRTQCSRCAIAGGRSVSALTPWAVDRASGKSYPGSSPNAIRASMSLMLSRRRTAIVLRPMTTRWLLESIEQDPTSCGLGCEPRSRSPGQRSTGRVFACR